MYKRFACLVSAFLILVIALRPASAQPVQCTYNYYPVDDKVEWCVPSGWGWWAAETNSPQVLADLLQSQYGGAITVADLGELTSETRIAVAVHAAVDQHIVVAQLFESDYDTSYSPEEMLTGSSITGADGVTHNYTIQRSDDGLIAGTLTLPGNMMTDELVKYVLPDLGRLYTVDVLAPNAAWDPKSDIYGDLQAIAYSLYVPGAANSLQAQATNISPDQGGASSPLGSTSAGQAGTSANPAGSAHVWTADDQPFVVQMSTSNWNGDPEASVKKLFAGASWAFNADSTASFTPVGVGTDIRTDLFPVDGTYRAIGTVITFHLHRESPGAAGNNIVDISGTLDKSSGGAAFDYMIVANSQTVSVTTTASLTQQLIMQ